MHARVYMLSEQYICRKVKENVDADYFKYILSNTKYFDD